MNNREWKPWQIQSCIDHIKTALDVDPWAKEIVESLLSACKPDDGRIAACPVRCGECWKREFDNCPFNEFAELYRPGDDFWCKEGETKPQEGEQKHDRAGEENPGAAEKDG